MRLRIKFRLAVKDWVLSCGLRLSIALRFAVKSCSAVQKLSLVLRFMD